MKKSKFNLTHMHSTTLDMGYLVPFCLLDCLPNDSYSISMNSFIRAQPMLAPLMHEVRFFTQYWYVPYRLLWDDWEQFITGGEALTSAPAFPTIKAPADKGFATGSLADYFGFPTNQPNIEVSAMPFRAMAEIWNTRYRDEDLQDEIAISYDSNVDTTTSTSLLSPSWTKDYFTTARATTQRGNQISVPILESQGDSGQYWQYIFSPYLKVGGQYIKNSSSIVGSGALLTGTCQAGTTENINTWINSNIDSLLKMELGSYMDSNVTNLGGSKKSATFAIRLDSKELVTGVSSGSNVNTISYTCNNDTQFSSFSISGSFVYKSASLTTSGSLDVRDLRMASALQRYQERSLLWGNRYEEFIQREFGMKPRDARIQRPEYLGGSKSVLQISEVLQTAEGQDTGVGTMRGHGVASMRQRNIRFRCPEHGLIIGLMSIRPRSVYTQGINRAWLKRSRLDFYTPELANIGMQEVMQQELYATADNKDVIFGYQNRYDEYRFHKPVVTGEFRTTALNHWNLARNFEQAPVLNSSFIDMASSVKTFKRPFAEQTQHSFLAMIRNNIVAYRPIPKKAKNILK